LVSYDRARYYSRQTILPELGEAGQERLRKAKVTVVGLGGLGSISTLYLALAGIGKLTLVDQDTVEIHNLHRQALYTLEDLMHPKVEVAARRLATLNPEVQIRSIADNVNAENVDSILYGSDCIVDGLDNMYTRYLLNRYCVKRKIPFIFGGAIGLEGNVAVLKSPETPCLECVLPGLEDLHLPTCDTRGILGATAGVIGALQALETIKILAATSQKVESKLMIFDFYQSDFHTIEIHIREDCPVCQIQGKAAPSPRGLAWLCGSNTVNVNPEKPILLELSTIREKISAKHRILLSTPMVIVFDYDGHEVSLFNKGRMLIKSVSDEREALRLYKEIIEMLGVT